MSNPIRSPQKLQHLQQWATDQGYRVLEVLETRAGLTFNDGGGWQSAVFRTETGLIRVHRMSDWQPHCKIAPVQAVTTVTYEETRV